MPLARFSSSVKKPTCGIARVPKMVCTGGGREIFARVLVRRMVVSGRVLCGGGLWGFSACILVGQKWGEARWIVEREGEGEGE